MNKQQQTAARWSPALLTTLAIVSLPAHAAIEVTPDHLVSGAATGTLVAVDIPFGPNGTTGGPNWTTGGGIVASPADQGFTTVNDPIQDYQSGRILWEPDGTPAAEAGSWFTYPNGPEPGVKWVFNQVDSGFDVPDGSVINAIYAVWFGRGSDGITYRYSEGARADSYVDNQGSASTGDLVLSWTDDTGTVRNANFQRIFTGPIVVEGGDGFELWGTDNVGNAAHVDAVVIDVTLPSTGTPPTIESYSPAIAATDVPLTAGLTATFSESLVLTGIGNVTIKNLDDGSGNSDIAISLPDPAQVSINGTILTINPTANLALDTNYSVRISADAIEDAAGDSFAGLLDNTWNFSTTSDATPPSLVPPTDPADGATDVPPFATLTATFSEDIVLVDGGTVVVKNLDDSSGDSDIEIALPDARVSVSETRLAIDPGTDLDASTSYAVRISPDAVVDTNGNPFAGIEDDTTWNFTTAAPPSGGQPIALDRVVSGSVAGSLLVVDVPFVTTSPTFGGPDWPEDADDGFEAPTDANDGIREPDGTSNWEPDGTPLDEAKGYFTYGNGPAPSVTWTFDLADGTVINAVYATWNTRGSDGITWQYSEGAASNSTTNSQNTAPASDLVLQWVDDGGTPHDGSFQRIFSDPITVEGDDGFTLWGTDNIGNAAHIDAIVLDISGKAAILTFEGAGATGVIDQIAKTIALEVPFGTDLATLAPTFTLTSGTCDQPSGAPPSPTFADAAGNTVTYTVTDDSTEPPTVNTYEVSVTIGPEIATLVIDLGSSPGTTIEAGADAFIGTGPTNLPLPALPPGSILRSIAVDATLAASDNENYTNDLAVLFDPTPGDPGGDFSLGIMSPTANVGFGQAATLEWTSGASETDPLNETRTQADWSGDIDLSTTGVFLGNAYDSTPGAPGDGGTWAGTITLTYEVGSGASAYSSWSGGEPFEADKNGDGISNGLAFLLGAANPDEDAVGRLPSVTEDAGGLVLSFTCRDAANRGPAVLNVQWSSDLGATDPWSANLAAVPGPPGGTVNEVVFAVTENATDDTLDDVVATIPTGKAAGGKLFGRLEGSEN